jgi:endonuclease YncB( thermonuclease family)
LIGVVAVVVALFEPPAPTLTGQASAIDGDTLRLSGERVRLAAVDAVEMDQVCTEPGGREWPCGYAATAELARLVKARQTRCVGRSWDRYGRLVARCEVDTLDLGATMAREGYAIADAEYRREEAEARAAKRRIWGGSFERPADWRRTHGEVESFDLIGWVRSWF